MNAVRDIPDNFDGLIAELGIQFDARDVDQLGDFLDLLFETNQVMNLTAIKTVSEAWIRHIADSLTLLPKISLEQASHVIDVGSGGGLPGIPLAITMPEVTFTLVETTKKKAIYLSQVVDALQLENVTVLAERAEYLCTKDGGFRDIADVVVARAVGKLPTLLELTIPFVKVGGLMLAIKGGKAQLEVEEASQALRALHSEVESMTKTETGTVVAIRKTSLTPAKYPRAAGEPKRAPIGKANP